MAAGTLASFSIQAIIMLYLLDRRVGGLGLKASAMTIVKMLIASAIMLAACLGITHVPGYPHHGGRIVWALQLIILMSVGAGVYLAACAVMGVGVMEHLVPRRRRAGAAVHRDTQGA
jgi:peptidoglycan biosynthesis protein MviN/MurJ (putative lipid II flippase)